MKTTRLFLLAVISNLIFLFSGKAQQIQSDLPLMEFEKVVHNFGEVFQGDNTEYDFKFTNKGKQPLIISDVKSGCGCTVPAWPKNPIMPGASDFIKVKYNSNIIGKINKQVTIISNASNSPIILRIEGNVNPKPTEILPVQP